MLKINEMKVAQLSRLTWILWDVGKLFGLAAVPTLLPLELQKNSDWSLDLFMIWWRFKDDCILKGGGDKLCKS